MQQIIAEILLPAIIISISPFGIVGLILILRSKRPKGNGLAYIFGWMLGAAAVFTLAMLLGSVAAPEDGSNLVKNIITAVLAISLISLAIKQFASIKKTEGETPKWFSKVSSMGPLATFGLAVLLSGVNPKNLLLALAAGTGVGALNPSVTDQLLAIVIFAVVVSLAVLVIYVAYLIGGKKLGKPLDAMRDWLIKNNSAIVGVILLLMGINILVKML